jgi:hypothetical protein
MLYLRVRFITDAPADPMYCRSVARAGVQTSNAAFLPGEPRRVSGRQELNIESNVIESNVLAARELIQEAREQVARSRNLIEHGRSPRQKAKQNLQESRKRQRGV